MLHNAASMKKKVHDYNFMLISIAVSALQKERITRKINQFPKKKINEREIVDRGEEKSIIDVGRFGNAARHRQKRSFATTAKSLKVKLHS